MLLVTFMKIIKMDNQGRGITYFNDKIVFVNNALPGEDVEIEIIIDKKKYSIANVKKFNIKSNNRIKSKCRYCDTCGGCQLQHICYHDIRNGDMVHDPKAISSTADCLSR